MEAFDEIQMEAGLRGLVKSMVALAASDHVIDDREVVIIASIFRDLTGHDLDQVEIKRAAEAFRDKNLSISEMLEDIEQEIDPEFKETIIKACYLVGLADEILVKVELEDVRKIGDLLKVPKKTVDGVIVEIEEMIQAERPYH